MPSYWQLLLLILPVFALIGVGAIMRRVRWLTSEADASLLKLVVNFLYPCLIFENVLGNAALRQPGNLLLAPLIGFATIAMGIYLSYYAARAIGLKQGEGLRTFAFSTGIYNYGYIALPLMVALFGPESVGVLLVHNVGCEAAIWTVGILMLAGLSLREGWRKLVNAPVFALFAAVLGNTMDLGRFIPDVAFNVIHMSAACAIPLGLMLIGATLMEYFQRPREMFDARVTLASSVLRLGVLPVLFLMLAKWLPVSDDLKRVIIVQAAMPAGILPLVIAKHYGGHSLTAVRVVIGTTVLGVFLIPLWLRLGLAWVM
ncbi:AEC family transporter [Rariglobus hedericola]|uniref:AEC family transporter n=1 Tax=Rariglobus hedericola TaxID=2597822 RepID=A0A556QIW3_9BACT|nr:AEC family transporter [Rariglobus hedericola]TSJ76569.1 AEC family transporter [Rariglobus hedericola]